MTKYRADALRTRAPESRIKQIVPRRLLRRIAAVWIVCLIVGSLLPGSAKVRLGTTYHSSTHHSRIVGMKHRVIHFLAFGSTALMLMLLAPSRRHEMRAGVGVMLLGCALEVTQFMIYSINFEWWDVRDDCYGIAGAFITFQIAKRIC